ncbi:permease [Nitrincola sp. A-D6]|uniref:permease n=1 Tax=Nitrincola sp. A-D6 TaxID=1545442 RepID=UPI000AB30AA9|nr:permease [Nitrincola sp. A-D6]
MASIAGFLSVALSAAPWLLLGLLIAGLIKSYMPEQLLQRWMGGKSLASIVRAAIIGVPLPLCSCGAIPTALALHRGGAGRGPTTAFLIGTPGVGVDSILLTSVLLGPLMAVARVLGAVITAISTGLLISLTDAPAVVQQNVTAKRACCANDCSDSQQQSHASAASFHARGKLASGLAYAFGDLLDDISAWLIAGLVLAGVLVTLVPPETLSGLSGGFLSLLLMAVIGIPLYICATAATPVAAGLLLAGITPAWHWYFCWQARLPAGYAGCSETRVWYSGAVTLFRQYFSGDDCVGLVAGSVIAMAEVRSGDSGYTGAGTASRLAGNDCVGCAVDAGHTAIASAPAGFLIPVGRLKLSL